MYLEYIYIYTHGIIQYIIHTDTHTHTFTGLLRFEDGIEVGRV